MPADYHTHTPLCLHAEGEPEQFIDAALAAGLSEYGIADHAPVLPEPFDDWRMLESQLPEYLEWIERARSHAAPHGLPIRAGLECDWLPGCESWIESLRARHSWDYLIGSIHYLGDRWDFDNPKWLGRWAETDVDAAWENYFAEYERMIRSQLFDIHAHPDLIKKFGYRPQGELTRYYEPVIQALADTGGAIEINTAGLHKPCAEAYPALDFLTLAGQAKIPIVLSSDAHHPSEVARDFPAAIALARQAGYSHSFRIEQGIRTPEPLPA